MPPRNWIATVHSETAQPSRRFLATVRYRRHISRRDRDQTAKHFWLSIAKSLDGRIDPNAFATNGEDRLLRGAGECRPGSKYARPPLTILSMTNPSESPFRDCTSEQVFGDVFRQLTDDGIRSLWSRIQEELHRGGTGAVGTYLDSEFTQLLQEFDRELDRASRIEE